MLEGTAGASHIDWSPDGRCIAYMSFVRGKPAWDPPMPAPPPGAKWAPPAIAITSLRWTFDGQGILKPGGMRIFVTPVSGGAPKQISAAPYHHTSYFTEPELAWSRDGRHVLTPAVNGADGWAVFYGNQVFAFPVAGGEPRQFTMGKASNPCCATRPMAGGWPTPDSPGKARATREPIAHRARRRWGVAGADSGLGSRCGGARLVRRFQRLYFLSDDHGAVNLYSADLNGSFQQLTHGAHHLGSISHSRAELLALRSTPVQPNAPRAVFDRVAGAHGEDRRSE